MAKGKKNTKAKSEALQSNTDSIALPPKPDRLKTSKVPGNPVELISNMYPIMHKMKKLWYCHTVQFELMEDKPAKSCEENVPKSTLPPRKIPKNHKLEAAKIAIGQWLENNPQQPSDVFESDSDGSTVYSTFKMLDEHDGSAVPRKFLSIESFAQSDFIVDQKVTKKKVPILVKIYSPTCIDVSELFTDLAGKGPRSSATIEDKYKAMGIFLTLGYKNKPNNLLMQSKGGTATVISLDRKDQFKINEHAICRKGFATHARSTEVGPVTVIANTCVPFFEPLNLLEILTRRYNIRDFSKPLPPDKIIALKKEFHTKQVEATHINYGDPKRPHYRKYRVHDIGRSAKEEKFELKDDRTGATTTISVFDYFKKEYPRCQLKYPNLPCIVDNKRKIPLEICRLVDNQKISRKLEGEETSAVIKQMAVKPEIHFQTIQKNAEDVIRHSQPMQEFGLEIKPKPIEVTGRELPSITLLAGNRKQLQTQGGGYNATRSRFVRPATVNKWALVILADEIMGQFPNPEALKQGCEKFGQMYSKAGSLKGVRIGMMADYKVISLKPGGKPMPDQELKMSLRKGFEYYNSQKFDHIIFVLPASRDWLYGYIQYLEVDVSKNKTEKCTRASRIKTANFVKKIVNGDERSANMFLSNLWLKYNTKLGGVNIALDQQQNFGIDPKEYINFLAPDYLFISIDVCHPAPGDPLEQSVAAAVGMWNLTNPNMSYCTRIRVQRKDHSDKEKSTVEQVGEIGVMFEDILQSYKTKNQGKVPTHIVILRDGVSDGQFQMVLRFELGQIKQRIANFYNKMNVASPKLTCLTVQKRHKVRFMRKQPLKTHRGDNDFNIQPGTVVDNKVIHPTDFSFYMAPHKAIQGTARAPYIYMIFDEIKFSQDAAQAMIFALSHLSPRCTKGTSIPTPVNLADLAAERGKHIVVSWNDYNQHMRLSNEERLVHLNAFLSTMGDTEYLNTLFYV